MKELITILLLLLFLNNCSLNSKSSFWSKKKDIVKVKDSIKKEIFKKDKASTKEFNPDLKINLNSKLVNNSFINNFDNNNGRINYNGKLKKSSKYSFSKIINFHEFEPEIIFQNDNIIFFDKKGSLIKFDNSSNLIWKKNYYNKSEKKLSPILFLASNNDTLVVADNITKYYAINVNNGELLWSKNNSSGFNSQIKIFNDKFFAIDFENILRCFSIKDGTELWKVKTEKILLTSQKKLSMIIINDKVIFNNSIGDVTAVDINSGNLVWVAPTQSGSASQRSFFLKTSDLIGNNKFVLLSNNKNEFFSLDINTGTINWQQKINSNLRSTLIDQLIFSVSNEGFLFVTKLETGEIIRITDLFSGMKKKKRSKLKPTGFIVGKDTIYLSTNNGRLLIINIYTGKTISTLKIDNEKISRPFVLNQSLYIVRDNSIIKLD